MNKICPLLSKTSKNQSYILCLKETCGFWDDYNKSCGIASIAWFQAQTSEALNEKG